MSPRSLNGPPPERPVRGLDHLLIVAHDLEAARSTYERLGFRTAPRGRHIGWGTANYCLMLEQGYLELLGIVDHSQFLNGLDETLATRGEGLSAAAFAGDDLDRSAGLLRETDVNVGAPQDLQRTIEADSGDLLPRFQLLHLPRTATPGLPAFICKHLTPELVWQPGWTDQPNGARRIAGLTVMVEDPGAVAVPYADIFGFRSVTNTDNLVTVDCGGCYLRFTDADGLLALHPQARAFTSPPPQGPVAMRVEVADKAHTASVLQANGVSFERDRDGPLHVPAAEAAGVMLDFV
ncbi:VOC family protein [Rhodovibrio salinarum]|nr:VOC family protein [Rhodovibrio salinarum]